ncbi:hypothetical protein GUJ93_ZPchr0013g34041 [Zizania palustris]|uniref:Glucose-6-phosphate dehydrogenase NAD-binding domain-containing protein n=1 Tax=Zizania palustris TaxID=103762 RepID=A0A8J5WVT8_ZIZPA|nr:hypothetical protein GUJ93_ZPchr0013g34041 [Zizania palustris]
MSGLAVSASPAPAPSLRRSSAASRFSPVAGPSANFRTQFCGLRCWITAKLKFRKTLKRHGWQRQRNLEVRANDCGGETANTRSDTLDSSMDEKSLMHLKLSPSETHPPVLKEDPVLFDDQPEIAASVCIAVIGATGELARNKVFPALFALYYSGFLPRV